MIKNVSKIFAGLFFCLTFTSIASAAPNREYDLSKGESAVTFKATGRPSALKINGHGAKLSGKINTDEGGISGQLLIKLDEFQTGIGLRDRHMKEKYLETAKFPTAVLTLSKVDVPKDFLDKKLSIKDCAFEGLLKIKDVERPVKGTAIIDARDGGNILVETDFKIKVSDFKIEIPTYMGVTVADEVDVHTKLKLIQ